MSVFACASEAQSECGRCECDGGDCSKYNFGEWMQFNCEQIRVTRFLRLTNEDGRQELAIAEVEAYGHFDT